MNAKHFNLILLLTIALTLVALVVPHFLPAKRLVATPSTTAQYYIHAATLSDSGNAGSWADASQRRLRCEYPPGFNGDYTCSFNQLFAVNDSQGLDLSGYQHIHLEITYNGEPLRFRISLRNYNPAYSRSGDANSTKYMAAILDSDELKQPVTIALGDFDVSDWWLDLYSIPRQLSHLEIDNVMSLGIDFWGLNKPGIYELEIKRIEFSGEWISREHWYLLILACWLLGIGIYASLRLLQLSRQSRYDTQVINSLSRDKQLLLQESDKFRRLSTVDPLTQAYNRFGIDQIVNSLLAQGPDNQHSQFALMVMDIDHFKRINDKRGHDTGDRVLQQVAQLIQQNLRPQDFLGRWGGEEFVVILPETSQYFALALAEKVRLVVFGHKFEPEQPLQVSLSAGVGEQLPGEDFASSFKRVDLALYQAKTQGRNCCVLAGETLA